VGENEQLPRSVETEAILSVHSVVLGLNLNGPPNNAIHLLCFTGEERGIVKLNAVSQVNAVFNYG
jgi:hypothetical protein